jgi:hypothetical protein
MSTYIPLITNGVVAFYDLPASYPLDLATAETLCVCGQVTSANIAATSNTTEVAATFCSPASTRSVASTFTMNVEGIQDWGRPDGEASFSEFLFANDGGQVLAVLQPEEGGDVKAVAEVSVHAGDFLGPAGTTLTFTGAFGVNGYPDIFVGPSPGTLLQKGQGGSTEASFPVTGSVVCPTVVVAGADAQSAKDKKVKADA